MSRTFAMARCAWCGQPARLVTSMAWLGQMQACAPRWAAREHVARHRGATLLPQSGAQALLCPVQLRQHAVQPRHPHHRRLLPLAPLLWRQRWSQRQRRCSLWLPPCASSWKKRGGWQMSALRYVTPLSAFRMNRRPARLRACTANASARMWGCLRGACMRGGAGTEGGSRRATGCRRAKACGRQRIASRNGQDTARYPREAGKRDARYVA